jgi:ketosteroid isomerase-like protein
MVDTPREVIEKMYAARAAKDRAAMFSLCDKAIIFTFNADPDRAVAGNTYVGIPASIRHLERVAALWEEIESTVGTRHVDGAQVTVRVALRLKHRATSVLVETTKTQTWTVRDGRVTAMSETFDRDYLRAFLRYAELTPADYDLGYVYVDENS